MHPDNNPLDLASGQLYMKHPETGERLPLQAVESITPADPEKDEQVDEITDFIKKKFNLPEEISIEMEPADLESFETWRQNLVAAYKEWLQKVVIEQEQACIKWAQEHRRKWLHIGRTTKKARTRKKYAKLIWRDYKAARAAALARIAGEG